MRILSAVEPDWTEFSRGRRRAQSRSLCLHYRLRPSPLSLESDFNGIINNGTQIVLKYSSNCAERKRKELPSQSICSIESISAVTLGTWTQLSCYHSWIIIRAAGHLSVIISSWLLSRASLEANAGLRCSAPSALHILRAGPPRLKYASSLSTPSYKLLHEIPMKFV